MRMKHKIFIDGQYGTTGLKIHEMLQNRDELEIVTISEADKKNPEAKQKRLNQADLVFLCLPDAAAKESVKLITNGSTKVIDASTAHRTQTDWTYGIPELNPRQRAAVINSKRVCVPGCHATGFIMAMNPLIENGIVSKAQKLICHSITGYSGGGKGLIDRYEAPENRGKFQSQRPYALGLDHKHIPEMKYILGLDHPPLFTPSVGNFKAGMLVMSYLIKDELLEAVSMQEVVKSYQAYYNGKPFVKIIEDNVAYLDDGFLDAMRCNGSNRIELSVYENNDYLVVISRLDNLGKGASGAAVQNMNLMLGLDEHLGLQE
jgi:N-acetyl-gamma-glutamyl-phosphate reductase